MRYTESKEQSAEWLRAAVAQMGRHDAACNPLSFAVWYEYASGNNPELSRALDESLRIEPRLADAAIARLHRDHISDPDQLAMQRASGELQRVMSGMAESAARTGDTAGAFGDRLGELSRALRAEEASGLGFSIDAALAGTAEMTESAASLQRKAVRSQHEIVRLRDDLSRARAESMVDPLTRLLNRRGFDRELQAMLDRPARSGRSHELVMLDIDRFKSVNDRYGHVMGDRVLQAVAEALRSAFAGPWPCMARFGGEEFAILLPDSDPDTAVALAQACCERVKAMKIRDRRTQSVLLTVTISAGVASVQRGDDAPTVIARADGALYAAKQAGRDGVKRA